VQSVAPSSESALLLLAKVTVVKIANENTSVCGDVAALMYINDGVTAPKYFGAVLMSI
jgi:hypothetical protein